MNKLRNICDQVRRIGRSQEAQINTSRFAVMPDTTIQFDTVTRRPPFRRQFRALFLKNVSLQVNRLMQILSSSSNTKK